MAASQSMTLFLTCSDSVFPSAHDGVKRTKHEVVLSLDGMDGLGAVLEGVDRCRWPSTMRKIG